MDVYILPLSYRVERWEHGRSEVIIMPSAVFNGADQYDTTIGILHPQRLRATGLVVGYTEAILQDIIEAYRNSYVHFIDP